MYLKVFIIPALICFFLLTGCSSLSKEECTNQNWREFAQRYTESQGSSILDIQAAANRACSKHNIKPNMNALKKGHQDGLLNYCKRQKAWDIGLDGESYNPRVCPQTNRAELEKVYDTAHILYQIEDYEEKASDSRDRISLAYGKISTLQRQKSEMIRNEVSASEISLIESKISALQAEISREQNQADQALMKAARLKQQIQIFKDESTAPLKNQ